MTKLPNSESLTSGYGNKDVVAKIIPTDDVLAHTHENEILCREPDQEIKIKITVVDSANQLLSQVAEITGTLLTEEMIRDKIEGQQDFEDSTLGCDWAIKEESPKRPKNWKHFIFEEFRNKNGAPYVCGIQTFKDKKLVTVMVSDIALFLVMDEKEILAGWIDDDGIIKYEFSRGYHFSLLCENLDKLGIEPTLRYSISYNKVRIFRYNIQI